MSQEIFSLTEQEIAQRKKLFSQGKVYPDTFNSNPPPYVQEKGSLLVLDKQPLRDPLVFIKLMCEYAVTKVTDVLSCSASLDEITDRAFTMSTQVRNRGNITGIVDGHCAEALAGCLLEKLFSLYKRKIQGLFTWDRVNTKHTNSKAPINIGTGHFYLKYPYDFDIPGVKNVLLCGGKDILTEWDVLVFIGNILYVIDINNLRRHTMSHEQRTKKELFDERNAGYFRQILELGRTTIGIIPSRTYELKSIHLVHLAVNDPEALARNSCVIGEIGRFDNAVVYEGAINLRPEMTQITSCVLPAVKEELGK